MLKLFYCFLFHVIEHFICRGLYVYTWSSCHGLDCNALIPPTFKLMRKDAMFPLPKLAITAYYVM